MSPHTRLSRSPRSPLPWLTTGAEATPSRVASFAPHPSGLTASTSRSEALSRWAVQRSIAHANSAAIARLYPPPLTSRVLTRPGSGILAISTAVTSPSMRVISRPSFWIISAAQAEIHPSSGHSL